MSDSAGSTDFLKGFFRLTKLDKLVPSFDSNSSANGATQKDGKQGTSSSSDALDDNCKQDHTSGHGDAAEVDEVDEDPDLTAATIADLKREIEEANKEKERNTQQFLKLQEQSKHELVEMEENAKILISKMEITKEDRLQEIKDKSQRDIQLIKTEMKRKEEESEQYIADMRKKNVEKERELSIAADIEMRKLEIENEQAREERIQQLKSEHDAELEEQAISNMIKLNELKQDEAKKLHEKMLAAERYREEFIRRMMST